MSMTVKELTKKIAQTEFSDEINKITLNINFPHINYEIEFTGLSSIYEFFLNQNNDWSKLVNLPNELKVSSNFFKRHYDLIFGLDNYFNDLNSFNTNWNSIKSSINNYLSSYNNQIFPIESSELKLLLGLLNENKEQFEGAFNYMTSNFQIRNSKEYFKGQLKSYEFQELKNDNKISKTELEKKTLNQVRNYFNRKISDNQKTLSEYTNNIEANYSEHLKQLDKLQEEKNQNFEEWFENTQNEEWKKWYEDKIETLSRLEKTYETKLKLEKPARYWQIKSDKYYEQGNTAKTILIWVVIVSSIFLSILLFTAPDWIFQKVFKGNEVSIVRWSIVFITLISLLVYAIRALTKYMFSSYHLARDAEERHTLTFFFLALVKDTEVNEEDRKMILQSLFSRTDTGLLKEDSSPTLPGGILEKLK
ncbi:hypothetical protein DI487_10330 [Flavobacterium sediminis]|uniref:DUF6161 domain-containing protein n=2 Tax=Flavobacterium sediminis TaxID=2201181 RepID=A0A2U8QVW0_9FLAO|nr:hypothetical protein DI487_10330 [Flavobacterium sediminis]